MAKSTLASPRQPSVGGPPSGPDMLRYIKDMLDNMADIAERQDEQVLARLIALAAHEAARVLRDGV